MKNELLMKHIEDGQKKQDAITDETVRNEASVFNITIVYTLLFIIIGVFYNSLLTSSIGTILNEDVKLIDFLGEGNTLNNDLIWTKLQSCVNNYRFYLFVKSASVKSAASKTDSPKAANCKQASIKIAPLNCTPNIAFPKRSAPVKLASFNFAR